MRYKTMVLELLEQQPELHEQLRRQRLLLSTLERYSRELKSSHQAWQEQLQHMRPGSNSSQIASEALEIALEKLQARLQDEFPSEEEAMQFLDGAMAFVRKATPTE
jgi:hypothetical protein